MHGGAFGMKEKGAEGSFLGGGDNRCVTVPKRFRARS